MRATRALAACAALALALGPASVALAEQSIVKNGVTGNTDVTLYREEQPAAEATVMPYTGADVVGIAAIAGGVTVCVVGGVLMAKGVRS